MGEFICKLYLNTPVFLKNILKNEGKHKDIYGQTKIKRIDSQQTCTLTAAKCSSEKENH